MMADAHIRPCSWLGNLDSQLFAHLPACSPAQAAAPTVEHSLTVSVSMQDITPLHIAIQEGGLKTAQSLLADGAAVNAKESEVLNMTSHTVKAHFLTALGGCLCTSILYKSQVFPNWTGRECSHVHCAGCNKHEHLEPVGLW